MMKLILVVGLFGRVEMKPIAEKSGFFAKPDLWKPDF
jgi:hypothetical protein